MNADGLCEVIENKWDFDRLIGANTPVDRNGTLILFLNETYCMSCKVLIDDLLDEKEQFGRLLQELGINAYYVMDESKEIIQYEDVGSIPTVRIYDPTGKPIDEFRGYMSSKFFDPEIMTAPVEPIMNRLRNLCSKLR